jgi:hypothetical protein
MITKQEFMRATLVLALVAGTGTFAFAAMVHNSQEDYYSNGSTKVNDLLHGGLTWYGPDPGTDALWQVNEKGYWETGTIGGYTGNYTEIDYTVFNDHSGYAPDPITSFHIPAPTGLLLDVTAPEGWTVAVTPGWITWTAVDPDDGIYIDGSLDYMHVLYAGHLGIGFSYGVAVDTGEMHDYHYGDNWVVSSIVPAPAAVLLGVMGLGLVGWVKRRLS